jgi:SAM-dependent methyltransferase
MSSQWQTAALSKNYLEGVRGAIPLAAAQLEVIVKIIELWHPQPRRVVDLGCGDGILGRAILEHYPEAKVWFVDFSAPMLEAARQQVGAREATTIVHADFADPAWSDFLKGVPGVDLVLSGYSIHHQPDDRKKALYAEIHQLMSPGGLFLNLDHVASRTPEVGALFDDYFIDHLHAFHRQSDPRRLRHDVADTYYDRPDKSENILALVELQCDWLREIGFQDVDCFFKIFELALFGGRKTAE